MLHHPLQRVSSSIAIAAFALSLGSLAQAQTNQRGEAFPEQAFNRVSRGPEIPAALGSRLPQVAAWYDRSAEQLREICQQDRHLRMDRQGRLHYVCEGLLPLQNRVVSAETTSGGTSSGTLSVTDTFLLHSKPGASKVIYLDFDGHTTTGTIWNTNFAGGADIVTPPYSTDATVTTAYSTVELDNIYSIWLRVVEDFAPFDVDVTTQDPGLEALRKSTTSDTQFGVRVCIGGSSYSWYGAGAGGVAYLNSFTWNTDTPCFVFTDQLGSGNAKYTAEATSHEAGHTFNLSHDGQVAHDTVAAVGYYQGHANWAPIMGVGYYKEVSQWSKGEYPYANNLQDDTAIISNIVGYRTDAHGDSITTATALTGSSPTATGIIERRADADLFAFTTGAGPVSFTATPAAPSPNLDIQLALYDGLGDLVTFVNPTTLGATLSTTLGQGTYYLAVDGIGTGDPLTAYNDYGSLGQYSLTGSIVPATGAVPHRRRGQYRAHHRHRPARRHLLQRWQLRLRWQHHQLQLGLRQWRDLHRREPRLYLHHPRHLHRLPRRRGQQRPLLHRRHRHHHRAKQQLRLCGEHRHEPQHQQAGHPGHRHRHRAQSKRRSRLRGHRHRPVERPHQQHRLQKHRPPGHRRPHLRPNQEQRHLHLHRHRHHHLRLHLLPREQHRDQRLHQHALMRMQPPPRSGGRQPAARTQPTSKPPREPRTKNEERRTKNAPALPRRFVIRPTSSAAR
jgi:hypothetical protein